MKKRLRVVAPLDEDIVEQYLDPQTILQEIWSVDMTLSQSYHYISRDGVEALKVRADILFKLLNKIVPDARTLAKENKNGEVANIELVFDDGKKI